MFLVGDTQKCLPLAWHDCKASSGNKWLLMLWSTGAQQKPFGESRRAAEAYQYARSVLLSVP